MNFKAFQRIFPIVLLLILVACSDPDNEKKLVDLHAVAGQDLVSIDFAENTETIVSTNSEVEFSVQGKKSNGVEISLQDDIDWSLSAGAFSSINQQGVFSAAGVDEPLTLTARFGYFSVSREIVVSSAKFDKLVRIEFQGDENSMINMCQSKQVNAYGMYEGEVIERTIDSNTAEMIEWTVSNTDGDIDPLRAFIEKDSDQVVLYTRAAGQVDIQARVYSPLQAKEVSTTFQQKISTAEFAGEQDIKICSSDDSNTLSSCSLNSVTVEQDQSISLIAVGRYQTADGTDYYENITRNSQWGNSNTDNTTLQFSSDLQQLQVTGKLEQFRSTIYAACGNIDQSLDNVDITQGVILDSELSCVNSSSTGCLDSSVLVSVDRLSVSSFDVTANSEEMTDNVSLVLDTRPDEIELLIKANFSNDSQQDITADIELDSSIIEIDGQTVIESTSTAGVYSVVGAGTAKIQLVYRDEEFIVLIEVP